MMVVAKRNRIFAALTLCILQASFQRVTAQEFHDHFGSATAPNAQSAEQIFQNVEEQTLQSLQTDVVEASAFGARTDIDFTPFGQFSNIEQFSLRLGFDEQDHTASNTCNTEHLDVMDVNGYLDAEVAHDLSNATFDDSTDDGESGSGGRLKTPRRARPNLRGSGVPPSVRRKIDKFDIGKIPVSHNSAFLSAPNQDSVLETSLATIHTCKGSAILVLDMAGEVAVFNLHDRTRNAVVITVDAREFALSPGRQLVLRTDDLKPHFLSAIGTRQLKLSRGTTAYFGDFSIAGLIKGAPSLRKVVLDKRHSHTIDQMLKTAVIIQMLRKSREKRS